MTDIRTIVPGKEVLSDDELVELGERLLDILEPIFRRDAVGTVSVLGYTFLLVSTLAGMNPVDVLETGAKGVVEYKDSLKEEPSN